MTFDFGKLGQVAAQEQQNLEGRVYKRVARITNSVGGRLFVNENDPLIEAFEVALGIKEGGPQKVAELLGITPSGTEANDAPAALPAAPERPMPVFNPDGSPAGVGLFADQARNAGMVHKLDAEGKVVGWQRPPDFTNAAGNQPTTAFDLDKVVPVRDKQGQEMRQVKIRDGNADPNLELKIDATGQEYFQPKPRLLRRS